MREWSEYEYDEFERTVWMWMRKDKESKSMRMRKIREVCEWERESKWKVVVKTKLAERQWVQCV